MLHFIMEQLVNRDVSRLDLTAAQGQIIGFLTHHEGAPCARDVEAFFGLSHPTVSGLLGRMEFKGFIELRPDPQDRRIKRIYLREKGIACSKQIQACIAENEDLIVEGFSREEREKFREYLDRAIENLGKKCPKNSTDRRENT